MAAEAYTIGLSAFKRALSDVIAAVGPPTGDPGWLENAYTRAVEIHGQRAFDPEAAFDLDVLSNQLGQIASRAGREGREARSSMQRVEDAGQDFDRMVEEEALAVENEERHTPSQEPEIVEAQAPQEPLLRPSVSPLVLSTEKPARPKTQYTRMPVRFAGVGRLPATKQAWWRAIKLAGVSFTVGFVAGLLARRFFE